MCTNQTPRFRVWQLLVLNNRLPWSPIIILARKAFLRRLKSPASTCSPGNNSFLSRERCLLNDNQNQMFLSFPHWESLQIATEWLKPGSVQAGRLIQKKRLEATASELDYSAPFTLGDFYTFLKRSFTRIKTPNVILLLQWYFHEGFCGKLGWAVANTAKCSSCWLLLSLKVSNVDSLKTAKKQWKETLTLLVGHPSTQWKYEEQDVFGP